MAATLRSDELDALVVAVVATTVTDPAPLVDALQEIRLAHPDVPVILVAMGGLQLPPGGVPGVTEFGSADDAVEALGHAVRYAAWLGLPRGAAATPDEDRAERARSSAHDALATSSPESWLDPEQVQSLLAPYGLAPIGELAPNRLEAADAAQDVGFPVAVQIADDTIVHKTDPGLVRVGLQSAPEVVAAVQAFERELHRENVPVLVQPVVSGVEIALGVVRDPGFGPLVMVAAGERTASTSRPSSSSSRRWVSSPTRFPRLPSSISTQ